jgi:signal transduction histidine kinase
MYTWRMLAAYFATLFAIMAVFFIPAVQKFTGIVPWEVGLVGSAHFLLGMLPQLIFRKLDTSKFILWEIFSDRFVMSSIPMFAAPEATFMWLFFSFMCIIEALIEAPSVYSAFMVFIPPAAAWVVFVLAGIRVFQWNDIWVMVTVATLTLIIWLFVANAIAQYREAHRDIEKSTAQAELEHRRAELSRDIHDAIAAIFTRILAVQDDENGETAALTRDGLRQLRDIVTALQAENTSIGFLASWMNHYSQQYFENTGIAAGFTSRCESPGATLEPVRIIHAMRIYQELCQNALKHSGAGRVVTNFSQDDKRVLLEFADDGRGTSPGTTDGYGFKNIAERAHELGAEISYVENPQSGRAARLAFSI